MAASAAAIARLGGEVLRDRPLGVEHLLARVEPLGRLLDVGAPGLEAHGVRDDELVGVALLLGEGAAALEALLRVRDRAVERGPAGAEAERGDHEARVAEDELRLEEPLPLDAADEVLDGDVDVGERERRGVRGADAVLVLGLAVGEALGPLLEDEPGRPGRGVREDRVDVGEAAVR